MEDSLTVRATLASLEAVSDFVQQKALHGKLSFKKTWELMLAVDEVSSNMVTHACSDGGDNQVSVHWKDEKDCVTVVLTDNGIPINPLNVQPDEEELEEESEQLGGMSTNLIQNMVDTAEYSREDGLNRVVIRKFRRKVPGPSSSR